MDFPPSLTQKIQPEIATVWRLHELVTIGVTLAGAISLFFTFFSLEAMQRAVIFGGGVLVAIEFVSLLLQGAQQRAWRYELWEDQIETLDGVIFKKRTLIPLGAVQFVDTTQGPIERAYGLMSLQVSTAAQAHKIPGLNPETAIELRQKIIDKAGTLSHD
jgi:membrane protein YdbS with pleckstrin-like domain